jgi:ferredoxin
MASKYKIKIDKDKCIGCGTCSAIAPKTFKLDKDNKAKVIDPEGNNDKTILQAAQSCAVQAIELKDKDGKKVFPKD